MLSIFAGSKFSARNRSNKNLARPKFLPTGNTAIESEVSETIKYSSFEKSPKLHPLKRLNVNFVRLFSFTAILVEELILNIIYLLPSARFYAACSLYYMSLWGQNQEQKIVHFRHWKNMEVAFFRVLCAKFVEICNKMSKSLRNKLHLNKPLPSVIINLWGCFNDYENSFTNTKCVCCL